MTRVVYDDGAAPLRLLRPGVCPSALVFAYGSNLNGRQMRARVLGSEVAVKGVLAGFRVDFVGMSPRWGGGVATVTRARGIDTPGLVWRLPPGGLDVLDGWEGFPRTYSRELLRIDMPSGYVRAWVYQHTRPELRPPSQAYLDTIARGAAAHGIDVTHMHIAAYRAAEHIGTQAPAAR